MNAPQFSAQLFVPSTALCLAWGLLLSGACTDDVQTPGESGSSSGGTADAGSGGNDAGSDDGGGSTTDDAADSDTEISTDGTTGSTGGGDSGDEADDSGASTGGSADDDSGETKDEGDDADGGDDWETGDLDPTIAHVRVEPQDLLFQLDLGETIQREFKAIGVRTDNSTVDLTDEVEWSFTLPDGEFDDNELEIGTYDEMYIETGLVQAEYAGVRWPSRVTVVAYDQSSETPDYLFVLPFEDPNGDQSNELTFATGVQKLDVFFSMDSTGSMADEIEKLRTSLADEVIPGVKKAVEDSQFGVAQFADFPVAPHGEEFNQPFKLEQAITDSTLAVVAGVARIEATGGNDYPESYLEALYQIATGEGLTGPGMTSVEPNDDGIGGVAFRDGSLPVIVPITDAVSHAPGESHCEGTNQWGVPYSSDYNETVTEFAHTRGETKDALEAICGHVITIASKGGAEGDCSPRYDGSDLAEATNTRVLPVIWSENRPADCADDQCCTGINGAGVEPDADGMCPLVFDVEADGSGLGESIVSGIKAVVHYAPLDVGYDSEGERDSLDGKTLPDGKDSLEFLTSIEPHSFGDLPLPGLPLPKMTKDGFEGVTPGTTVTFEITAFNDFLEQIDEPQVFKAKISVSAEQCARFDLDEREVVIVVPPKKLGQG